MHMHFYMIFLWFSLSRISENLSKILTLPVPVMAFAPLLFQKVQIHGSGHCAEVQFVNFLSGRFTTAKEVNPLKRQLTKRFSVHCRPYIFVQQSWNLKKIFFEVHDLICRTKSIQTLLTCNANLLWPKGWAYGHFRCPNMQVLIMYHLKKIFQPIVGHTSSWTKLKTK